MDCHQGACALAVVVEQIAKSEIIAPRGSCFPGDLIYLTSVKMERSKHHSRPDDFLSKWQKVIEHAPVDKPLTCVMRICVCMCVCVCGGAGGVWVVFYGAVAKGQGDIRC